LTRRYGAHGQFWRSHSGLPYFPVQQWEIWNEENNGSFWQPAPDPARYIDLYLATRRAIRSIDGGAKVVIGGLVGDANTNRFIAGMYQHRADAKRRTDAIALHPYPQDVAQSAASSMQLIGSTRTFLDLLVHRRIPLEITEIGWTTEGAGAVSDATRALELTQLIDDLVGSDDYVTLLVPYTWISPPAQSALLPLLLPQPAAAYGMFNWDGSPTREGEAYLAAIKQYSPVSARAHRRHRYRRHHR